MQRLRVIPEALKQGSGSFQRFSQNMLQLRSQLDQAAKRLEWESVAWRDLEQLIEATLKQASQLSDWAHKMGSTLEQVGDNYLSEDQTLAGKVGRIAGSQIGTVISTAVAVSASMGVKSLEALGLNDARTSIAMPPHLGYAAYENGSTYRTPYSRLPDPGGFPGHDNLGTEDLKFIQHVLRIPISGEFDQATKAALADLQWEHRFAARISSREDADGVLGKFTWDVLRAINHARGVEVVIADHDMTNLITDEEFLDKDALNLPEIRSFLENQNSILATDRFPIYRISDENPGVPGALWHEGRHVWKIPTGESIDPAQAIYDAAQRHGINPLVLLTKLQKESSLISSFQDGERMDPTWLATTVGMGFGAPDSGEIDYDLTGLDVQIDQAARRSVEMFNEDAPSKYPHVYTPLNHEAKSDVTVDGVNVPWAMEVDNRATWVLYRYTPHVIDTKLQGLGGGNLLFAELYSQYKKEVSH